MSCSVTVRGAVKRYGDFTALKGVSLEIREGEFFTLLGPSGCGKTTLLRMIAGFNSIEEGEILFGSEVINRVPAHKRDAGMVFQNYAVFPHMTVEENVAYGLKAKHVPQKEISERVQRALEQVQIAALAKRRPNELSGGQQQRVALARAFVFNPRVLLMDEPLSNLDAKLRVQMRTVIRKLQRDLGITTIYVTHDQEEALAISDRIAVMNFGEVMQVGVPEEIYSHPKNAFVAGFIGVTNMLEATLDGENPEKATLHVGSGVSMPVSIRRPFQGKVQAHLRPEKLYFSESGLHGEIILSTFLGDYIEYEVQLDNGTSLQINEYTKDKHPMHKSGEKVCVSFDGSEASLFTEDGKEELSW